MKAMIMEEKVIESEIAYDFELIKSCENLVGFGIVYFGR